MNVTSAKNCFCHTCSKDFHYLGINRHRARTQIASVKRTIPPTPTAAHTHSILASAKERFHKMNEDKSFTGGGIKAILDTTEPNRLPGVIDLWLWEFEQPENWPTSRRKGRYKRA